MSDIFEKGFVYMQSLIGMTVSVQTVNSMLHEGIVFGIDPVHETVILGNEKNKYLKFIMRHSIESFVVFSDTPKIDLQQRGGRVISSINTDDKKGAVKKWLKQMYIGVEDCGKTLKIDNHVVIEAPYTSKDCFSDNTVVLERVRNLIKLMPEDFK